MNEKDLYLLTMKEKIEVKQSFLIVQKMLIHGVGILEISEHLIYRILFIHIAQQGFLMFQ